MRFRPLLFALLVFAVGVLAYGVTRRYIASAPVVPDAEARQAWLAREFRLTPAQSSEIARLQSAYEPVCVGHCAAILEARETLAVAATPEARAAAESELDRLKTVCAVATRAHLQAVAALMPPAQGPRFLALMEPRVAHTPGRSGAPALAPAP